MGDDNVVDKQYTQFGTPPSHCQEYRNNCIYMEGVGVLCIIYVKRV